MLLIKSFPLVTNQSSVDIWELARQTLLPCCFSVSLLVLLTSVFFPPHFLPSPPIHLSPLSPALIFPLSPSPSISFILPLAVFLFFFFLSGFTEETVSQRCKSPRPSDVTTATSQRERSKCHGFHIQVFGLLALFLYVDSQS